VGFFSRFGGIRMTKISVGTALLRIISSKRREPRNPNIVTLIRLKAKSLRLKAIA